MVQQLKSLKSAKSKFGDKLSDAETLDDEEDIEEEEENQHKAFAEDLIVAEEKIAGSAGIKDWMNLFHFGSGPCAIIMFLLGSITTAII